MFEQKCYIMKQSIKKEGTNKSWFTLRWVTFNTKRFAISSDEAKDIIRKSMKKSRDTIDNDYDVVYAKASKIGRAGNTRTEYSSSVKMFSNTVFVIPKCYRKEAKKAINELVIEGNYTF